MRRAAARVTSPLSLEARVALLVAGTGGAAWAVGTAWAVWHGRRYARAAVDEKWVLSTALVLGCHPGPRLARRVLGAVSLWRAGQAQRIVVSGRGEAEVGVSLALEQGVPREALVAEVEARTTLENLTLGRGLLGPGPTWLVTDDWHMPRALRLAQVAGVEAKPAVVSTAWSVRLLAREGLSVVKTVVAL